MTMLTTREAADRLGCTLMKVCQAVRCGRMPGAVKVLDAHARNGMRWMIPEETIVGLGHNADGTIDWLRRCGRRKKRELSEELPVPEGMQMAAYTHWGRDAYSVRLPHNEAEALQAYLKASAGHDDKCEDYGTSGVTVFRPPLIVLGVVRGLSEEGDPTVVLIVQIG